MIPAPSFSAWATIEVVSNHLWQSTLFAAAASLLTLVLRNDRAQVRYWLWLAASVKFLFPFAALVAIGGQFGWRSSASSRQSQFTFLMDAVSQPFSRPEFRAIAGAPPAATLPGLAVVFPTILLAIWFFGCATILVMWWSRWRRVAMAVREATPVAHGKELDALRRLEQLADIRKPIAMVSAKASVEPGVFGIVKPVLLWPYGISDRLDDEQVEAVLIHELAHIRRCDNLAAVLHMLVGALFWFHPLVWWLGARLVDERERACDEEVVRLGSDPQLYAESILTTCEFYTGSPVACVSGVTGSDLKKRIEAIMRSHKAQELNRWRKLLLAMAGATMVVAPVGVGVLNRPVLRAQSKVDSANAATFEVASVKPNKSGDGPTMAGRQPGGRVTLTNIPLRLMIRNAYQLQDLQIVDAPKWMSVERFDIVAKAAGNLPPPRPGNPGDQLMMRSLLADRFKLVVHQETRELASYALELARRDGKLGPQLRPSTVDCAAIAAARERSGEPPPGAQGVERPQCGFRATGGRATGGQMMAGGFPFSQLAVVLSQMLRQVVIDKTGLTGNFDFELNWTPDEVSQRPSAGAPSLPATDPIGPSMLTALQEQLGLKLRWGKGLADVLVIDHVERPTPD
jgi:uncharacterized protein (TIGR03435 family)